MNLWRPYDPSFIRGNCYFIIIINDNTRKIWTYSVTSKDMFFLVFKMWKKRVEIEIGLKLSTLQIDSRDKYNSLVLKKFYREEKVVIEFTSSYTLEQNSIVKQS